MKKAADRRRRGPSSPLLRGLQKLPEEIQRLKLGPQRSYQGRFLTESIFEADHQAPR